MKIPVVVSGGSNSSEFISHAIDLFLRVQTGRLASAPRQPRDISNQLNQGFFEAIRILPKFQCLAPSRPQCVTKPISSHSIQSATTLSFLSDPTGHVLSFKTAPDTKKGIPSSRVERIGIHEASTFPGLCATHDSEVFKPAESGSLLRPTNSQLFLLAYRAVLRQLVQEQVDAYRQLELSLAADKQPFRDDETKAVLFSQAIHAVENWRHSHDLKQQMDKAIRKGSHSEVVVSLYRVVQPVGFSVSAALTPLQDFDGRQVWGTWTPAVMMLSVLPSKHGTLIAVTVPRSSLLKLRRILKQLRSASDEHFVRMVWELALRGSENLFISPECWDTFSRKQQDETLQFWHETHYQEVRTPDLLLPEFPK